MLLYEALDGFQYLKEPLNLAPGLGCSPVLNITQLNSWKISGSEIGREEAGMEILDHPPPSWTEAADSYPETLNQWFEA